MNADGTEGPDDPRLQESFNRYSEKLSEQVRDIRGDSGSRAAFNEQVVADLKPVRPLHPAAVFALGFLIVSASLVFVAIWSLGSTEWHRLMLHQRISVLTSLFASAALLSFSLSRQMLPGTGLRFVRAALHTGERIHPPFVTFSRRQRNSLRRKKTHGTNSSTAGIAASPCECRIN